MPFHVRNLLSLILMAAACGPESYAAAGSWVKVNGNTYSLSYAYAVPSPNALDSEKANGTFDTYLILVDTAIPGKYFADPFWYSHIRKDAKIHGLFFVVDVKKQLIGGGLLAGSLEAPDGIWTLADFKVTASDAQHVEGSGKIAERRLPEGTTLAFDVTLNAPVWKPVPEKPATPEDGKRAVASVQAKVYLASLAALKSGNNAAVMETLSADAKKEMALPPDQLAVQMKMLREMAPKNPRALRLTVDGGSAELEVADTAAGAGTIQFVLEAGQWKIRSEDWK
jgi:hypothetical protein